VIAYYYKIFEVVIFFFFWAKTYMIASYFSLKYMEFIAIKLFDT